MKLYAVMEVIPYEGESLVTILNSRSEATKLTEALNLIEQYDISYIVKPVVLHGSCEQYIKHKDKRTLANKLVWLRRLADIEGQPLNGMIAPQLEKYKNLL